MEQHAHDCQAMELMQVPTSTESAACILAAAGMSGDEFLQLIRERERYQWLADKVERWVGLYSVPELVSLIDTTPTMPGQRQKALVALSLTDDLSALVALEDLEMSGRTESFQILYQVALGQWRQRYRAQRID